MRRILVPVSGSDVSIEAVKEAIRQAGPAGHAEIHLLNIQPRIFPQAALDYVPIENMDTYYYERCHTALAPAEKILRDAGIPFVSHHMVGPVAESIVEKQCELECDSIVMGIHERLGAGGVPRFTVSGKVLQVAQVPVTLVKEVPVPGSRVPDFTGRLSAT